MDKFELLDLLPNIILIFRWMTDFSFEFLIKYLKITFIEFRIYDFEFYFHADCRNLYSSFSLNAWLCFWAFYWLPEFVFELFIGCLPLHFRECSFLHIPSLLHEETVDQHCSRERFSSWSYLPLSPGQKTSKSYGLI